ncbi:MAG: serine/threonine-protein kinase [Aggregatilineales bacterium]
MTDLTHSLMNTTIGRGRYQILERIGAGGMARVFKGYDTNLDRSVAIKIMHEHLSENENFKERFEQEAKFVASLNHPNIVQMYDFDSFNRDGQNVFYMVMSYVPGITLQDRLKELGNNETLAPHDEVLKIMIQLCAALGYAHNRGAVHRDVKPANILLNERGEAILTDFGIARLAQSTGLTQEGSTVGTPTYMSPEQATGEAIDQRSDLYALGIILYEMLAGKPPFADDGTLSVLLRHLNDPVPSLSNTHKIGDDYLDAVIFKALAKLPEERYQSAEEFGHDLKMAFDGKMPDIPASNSFTQQFTVHLAPDQTPIRIQSPASASQTGIQALKPKALNSPLGILAAGLAILAALLFIGLINQQGDSSSNSSNNASSTIDANNIPTVDGFNDNINAVDSMTGSDNADSMTGPVYFISTFSQQDPFLSYWSQEDLSMLVREVTDDGFYRIDSELSDRAVATIFPLGNDYSNGSILMTALLEEGSSPASGYGIIFRYIDDDNYNVFAVDGLGRYSIWVRTEGQWRELRGESESWTSNDAVMPLGQLNTLIVEVDDNQLIGYLNGETITTVFDDTIEVGQIGIYVASPPQGRASILVDTYQVTNTRFPLADSMTGNDDPTVPQIDVEQDN